LDFRIVGVLKQDCADPRWLFLNDGRTTLGFMVLHIALIGSSRAFDTGWWQLVVTRLPLTCRRSLILFQPTQSKHGVHAALKAKKDFLDGIWLVDYRTRQSRVGFATNVPEHVVIDGRLFQLDEA